MSTATTAPSKYDPIVTLRIPAAVRLGLKKLAKDKGDTLTGVILGHIRPFELYASQDGQDVLQRLEEVVARSTAIHRGLPTYHDSEGHEAHPPVKAWYGLHLENYGTSEEPLWLHRVNQREGQSREAAVKEYALDLWKEWGLLPTEWERAEFVRNVESGAHMFVVAYVGFHKWKEMPSSYEADLHRQECVSEAEPSTSAEVRLYAWCVEWLTDLHAALSTTDGSSFFLTRSQPKEGDFPISLKLTSYTDCTEEENIRRWARQIVQYSREVALPEKSFEALREHVENEVTYEVRRVQVHKDR